MIGSIYPTSPAVKNSLYQDNERESDALREYKATRAMVTTVTERGKYFYTYSEYMFAIILKLICSCCCDNKAWYKIRVSKLERHKDAKERLMSEVDL